MGLYIGMGEWIDEGKGSHHSLSFLSHNEYSRRMMDDAFLNSEHYCSSEARVLTVITQPLDKSNGTANASGCSQIPF